MNIKPASEWLNELKTLGLSEIESMPINKQLEKFNNAGTGIGLIFVYSDVYSNPDLIEAEMINFPVLLIKNQWWVVSDDNLADMVRGLFSFLVSNINVIGEPESSTANVVSPE